MEGEGRQVAERSRDKSDALQQIRRDREEEHQQTIGQRGADKAQHPQLPNAQNVSDLPRSLLLRLADES